MNQLRANPRHFLLRHLLLAAGLALASVATPAGADWLVTLQGKLIETDGPWTVAGEVLTYTDLDGVEQTLPLDGVDLEGSEETTAFKAGRPYTPAKKPAPVAATPAPAARAASSNGDEPEIVLYMTSWCGYCRKANRLLRKLDADFVAKNIEKDREAAREFREKSGGRGGIPLIDFAGQIVRGYNERLIRRHVRKLRDG